MMIQGVRTKYVADALNEYATKNRDAVSEGIITGGTQGSNGGKSEAKYWMCITKSTAYDSKKRREEEKAKKNKGRTPKCSKCGQSNTEKPSKLDIETNPGCQYTAFACGRPDTDVSKYVERWMNETGYRALEEQMPHTRSPEPLARLFCDIITLILYNLMLVTNYELLALCNFTPDSGYWYTYDIMVAQFIRILQSLLDAIGCLEPKPPPHPS